jgi:hypothetical protein
VRSVDEEGRVLGPQPGHGRRFADHYLEDAGGPGVTAERVQPGAEGELFGGEGTLGVFVVGTDQLEEVDGDPTCHRFLYGRTRDGGGRAVVAQHSDGLPGSAFEIAETARAVRFGHIPPCGVRPPPPGPNVRMLASITLRRSRPA